MVMRYCWIGLVAMLPLSCAASAQRFDNQTFDNKSVVALHRAGLGDTTIIAKVNGLPCGYDVSTDGLIALKQAGLPDDVIGAMVARCNVVAKAGSIGPSSADPSTRHKPGIYVPEDGSDPARMQPMRPSKASGIKVSGNGSILLPFVGRLVLPDEQSRVAIKNHRPVFYFYFLAGDENVSDFGTPNSIAAQSPDEFSLVRFKVKKNEREVGIGKISVYSSRRGIDPKDAIRFDATEIGPSAFKVVVDRDLDAGEYAFVLTGANNAARVYDFTIQ